MGRTDRVALHMPVDPDRVYAALTDREALETWLPPTGMSCTVLAMDLRPDGELRMVMRYADASGSPGKSTRDSDIVVSRFVDVVPGECVIQAVQFETSDPDFSAPMTMAWTVAPAPGGAVVEFRADDVPPGISAEDHRLGMTASLQQLAAYLACRAPSTSDVVPGPGPSR